MRRRCLQHPEAGLAGPGDEEQLAHCLANGRVLFTQDHDFPRIDAQGIPHAGIVYCVKDTKPVGELIQRLILIWEIYEPEDLVGRVEYL